MSKISFLMRSTLAALLWLAPAAALGQTSPGWPFGYVPTVAEWNAAFASKTDFTGSPAITSAGGTFTGKVIFANSSSGSAGMNCGVGTAPSSPVNGDVWCTTAGMFVYAGGVTIGPFGAGAGGTLAVSAGGTGVTTITSGNVLVGQGTSPITNYPTSGTNARIASTTITSAGSGHCVSINGAGDLVDAGVGACGGTGGSGSVNSSTIGQVAVYTGATAVTGIAACNNGYYGTNGAGTVSCITTVNTTLSATITALGTIASGTWQGGVIAGQYGGTGVANTGLTITLAGNLVTSGANSLTLTTIGATNVTFPTSGALMNQNGTSGGIPYYNSTTSTQSSALLTANLPLFGGGAGASPFSGTRTGSTTNVATYTGSAPTSTHCAQWDASGNLTDSGATCAGASGGAVLICTLSASASTSLTDVGNCTTGANTCISAGCFTSTYLNYLVVLTNLIAGSPSTGLGCQVAIYNGSPQVSGYIVSATQTSNGGTNLTPATPTTYIPCTVIGATTGANTDGTPGVSGQFTFYNPNPMSGAAKPQVEGRYTATTGTVGAPTQAWGLVSAIYNVAAGISGFRVCFGTAGGTCAGTIASGTIKVYGLP